MQSAAQVLIYPVQMSQLLYSERCISEVILDETEKLEVSVDNKRTTLLSAVRIAVSSDHKNIKVLANVLSKFQETRELADKLLNQYSKYYYTHNMVVLVVITFLLIRSNISRRSGDINVIN